VISADAEVWDAEEVKKELDMPLHEWLVNVYNEFLILFIAYMQDNASRNTKLRGVFGHVLGYGNLVIIGGGIV